MIKSEEYAIYMTTESEGRDVCIVDPLGRYTLINVDNWERFVSDVIIFNPYPPREYPAGTTFKEMEDPDLNDLVEEERILREYVEETKQRRK